nr:alpha-mannosidase [Acidimicrobiia bacterium]
MTSGDDRSPPRPVAVIPHTHWDREWYLPFQTFRLRLVALLDELLPALEADPAFAHFTLDGQLAVVDDHVAVRPEHEALVRRLVTSGRVSVGPWYTLPDEFLVSGETLVRDLQVGMARAEELGGAMAVGYLPDMFGHVAQMPQLLAQCGFDHAVVWRGVPASIDRSAFRWTAPDGTAVRAEYLPTGYGNGARVPATGTELVARIDEFARRHVALLGGAPVLWMNGTDHLLPQPHLGRVVTEANAAQDDYELRVTSLPEALAAATAHDTAAGTVLPTHRGELRSGARANLLMGVVSNRVDVRIAAARAERALERRAEPLTALLLPPGRWPAALLAEAWLGLLRNAAHDSVCACSADEVVDAVVARYAEARQLGDGLGDGAVAAHATTVAHDGPVVMNPAARTRSGLVELDLLGVDAPAGTQDIEVRGAEAVLHLLPSIALGAGLVAELEYLAQYRGARIEVVDGPAGDPGEVIVDLVRSPAGQLVTADARAVLEDLMAGGGEPAGPRPCRVVVRQEPGRRVIARVEDLGGYAWRGWRPAPLTAAPVAVGTDDRSLGNGLVDVVVDPTDGTWVLTDDGGDTATGLGRLVDGGDVGDTYNWCPPDADAVVDRPTRVTVEVTERGPLRARLVVRAAHGWPTHAEGGARVGLIEVEVVTTLELRAGERLVRVTTALDNRACDHRLRVHLALPRPAAASEAGCAFAAVTRGLVAEGGPTETALATYPADRFVRAGGLTVVVEGVTEYELVSIDHDGAHELALTMLRATGWLSQGPMATRPLPAGPVVALEGPQLQKPVAVRWGLALGGVDPWALHDDAFLP